MINRRVSMAQEIKLLATDMDGTFLDENGQFDRTRLTTLLPKLAQENIIFAVASGRPLLALEELFKEYLEQIALVAENGSVVTYQGEILFEAKMTTEQYLDLADVIKNSPYAKGTDLLLSGKDGAYMLEDTSPSYRAFMAQYYENIQLVSSFSEVTDDIFKVTTNISPEEMEAGVAWLNQAVPYATAVTTGFESVDIILKDVHKGVGLEHLCQGLGIGLENVVAFGDNLNDLEMMGMAGYAVAPENAREAIKKIADIEIGHAHTGAVLAYMEGLVDDVY